MALLKNTVIQGQLFVGGPVQASSFIENNVPLVNKYLGITATANAAKTITETLPITKGGTGATTADDAMLAMMNGVGTWTGPVNAERLLAANANGCGTYTLDQLWTDYYQKKFMHGSSSYNCDTQYDTGMYCISNGSNGPSTYGALFVQSYRQHSGNTKPDFAAQIFIPNGDANANEMYFRTSKSNEWDAWQKVATENWVTNKGYITSSSLPTKVSDLTNDSNFISNTANAFSYSNLSDKPTIPTNNNQLDNGAGYITSPDGGNASQLEGSTKQQIIDSARSNLVTTNTTQIITGFKTFASPAAASGDIPTVWFNTANGGRIGFGQSDVGGGSAIMFEQEVGKRRLNFRATTVAGSMVWGQRFPGVNNSTLYMDVDHISFRNSNYAVTAHIYPSSGVIESTTSIKAKTFYENNKSLSEIYQAKGNYASSTHTHTITSTSTATGGATPGTSGPAGTVNVAGASHTHTVSFTVTTPLASGESVAKFSVSGTTLTITPVDIQVSGSVASTPASNQVAVASSSHTHTVNSHTHTYYKADSPTSQPKA